MRKNILRIKLAFTIIWVNVVYLIVTFSIEYINRSLFYNYGSFGNYIDFILFLFATKVMPLTVIYFIILFVVLKPLQAATNQLRSGRELDEQLRQKALKNILHMSRTLIIANISGYVIGVILRLYTEYGYPQLDSYEGWIQILYGFALGATLSLIQISINNLLLIDSKRLFKLHYLEKKNNIENVFGIRIFWVGLFLIIYVSLYIYDNMRNSYEQEIKYPALLESVVKKEITIEQAEGLCGKQHR
ncbi:MAG: hypothetical protein JW822_05175 [Spirochaetales bacterium]|nr:hypothetical protein [Spirochaetales bacterium]